MSCCPLREPAAFSRLRSAVYQEREVGSKAGQEKVTAPGRRCKCPRVGISNTKSSKLIRGRELHRLKPQGDFLEEVGQMNQFRKIWKVEQGLETTRRATLKGFRRPRWELCH